MRYSVITRHRGEFQVRLMCRVLAVSVSGYYASLKRPESWHQLIDELLMARVRAMENRRWLLRDTNNGITAIIDPFGRVRARLAMGGVAALHGHFAARSGQTFYTEHGDWLPWLCTIFVGLMALAGGLRRRLRRV